MEDLGAQKATKIVEHLFRKQSGKMSAILTRIFGFQNSELIEDIIQETFLSAIKTWPLKGFPENPEAWLMLVAKNKIINELNRKKRHAEKRDKIHYEEVHERIEELFLDHEIKDSQLRVLFACCHPDLKVKAQIMLTLKVLSGFGDKEIANALLMKSDAVKKGIFRARQRLKNQYSTIGIPYLNEIKDRIETVLTIIYLMFNEGYKTSTGNRIINEELCYEAIRLAYLLLEIEERDKGKTYALLSLMYLSLARFPSRISETGELIGIELQDRGKWDKELIEVGIHFLKKSRQSTDLSRYHLESTIASIHCTASSFSETNWSTILLCYKKLMLLDNSFMVELNYAIALGRAEGFEKGLIKLKGLEKKSAVSKRSLLFASIGEMNLQLKRYDIAKSYYQVALDLATLEADKSFLKKKILLCDTKNVNPN